MSVNTVDYSNIKQSIRDLTKIYKPENTRRFVKEFVQKYNVQKGFEKELEAIVREELAKLKQGATK